MYIFKACYLNYEDDRERFAIIEVEEQFFDNEEEIYIEATAKAYNGKAKNECLSSIEFICC